ncbi:antibiotic biosynthesis monooxygenase [Vagococcus bubulae]|uniref:ABM domain-containing protein n=1 Tax=Vagococcus bubulae TaxID=1977868 RepID=A0A429ZPH7_9ENTE|nr:antibiotic biosynthesis monooxygenase [Vagococcus bubulae]RST95620.1 hypothetical protein CBF36_02765 [Vagococcus bubulae]
MYSVTNTIHIETPFAENMIQRFTSSHTTSAMEKVDGFIQFQLMTRVLPEDENVTELVVLSLWDSKEQQKAWVKSQSFKDVHKKEESTGITKEKPKRQGFIKNSIAEYDVLV